jgi:hypothetical protein
LKRLPHKGEEIMSTTPKLGEMELFGLSYLRWASKLFVTGLCLQLVPLVHYPVGGVGHPVTEGFLAEVVLWFGCPAEVMTQILLVGGLSLFAVGFSYMYLSRTANRPVTSKDRLALKLCIIGLIAVVVGGVGLYILFDYVVYPNFFFSAHDPERAIWLVAQLIGFSVYFVGILIALGMIKKDVNKLLVSN